MTVADAAKYAQKNPETIRRWIRSEKLTARKDDQGEYIIDIDELRACINNEAMTKLALGTYYLPAYFALTAEENAAEAKDAEINIKDRLELLEQQRKAVEQEIASKIDELRRLSEDIGILQASLRK